MEDKIRPSSFIFRSGPGSIIDLPERESRLVMGTAFWRNDGHDEIKELRLEKSCGVDHFGSPRNTWIKDNNKFFKVGIATRDFPLMKMCPKCGKLSYPSESEGECSACKEKMVPPRLVAACSKGHIEDFPWKLWCGCKCSKPNLFLKSKDGTSTSIENENSDLIVKCLNCGSSRNLMGALNILKSGEFIFSCRGNRPWLADSEECNEPLRGLMRGASNVYFPVIESSLSIPPFSNEIQKYVQEYNTHSTKETWVEGNIKAYISITPPLRKLIENKRFTEDDLVNAFNVMFDGTNSNSTNSTIKSGEWDSFSNEIHYEVNDDFKASPLDISGTPLTDWFDRILEVKRLREVIALKGFTRVEPYNFTDEDRERIQKINIESSNWEELLSKKIKPYIEDKPSLNWLPGIEQYGEGIFFKFNEDRISEWKVHEALDKRWKTIISNELKMPIERDGIDTEDPRILLVHSFAHQFIRQISLSCGYPSPSLRERIYVGTDDERDMCGVLIYTASSDSAGSLGGLVSQAKTAGTLLNHINEMLNSVRICSQDPLCASHDPMSTGDSWGASCHSCMHLAETSCEGLQNKLLDRFSLIGDGKVRGYFDEWSR